MKTKIVLKVIYAIITITIFINFTSCASDDTNNSEEQNPQSDTSFISYDVIGNAINGIDFRIPANNETNLSNVIIAGAINPVGFQGILNLTFSSGFGLNDNFKQVTIQAPASVGSHPVGEIQTTNTGIITDLPDYYTIFAFDDAFYDSDNDMDNDVLTDLLSQSITVQILELETVEIEGLTVLKYVKGTLIGGAIYKAFTSPTTDPQELHHTVNATFEYHLPTE
ncbi:hypothetical protein H8K90_09615 [Winogradskyella echinorum]|uniref:Uncharacterized protein n=1 Tax=Winogradskyella echinorum TaxID=538189 RepID=A0ABR6Y1L8_9FLAO|nr:hypothetical protein [Winogradskyella echinorum]MBC3846636.1 hypothetical protein [Winogradskyella echinorum]MBC5750984.1 hypothetical protein [Winogradskyella echinorum]